MPFVGAVEIDHVNVCPLSTSVAANKFEISVCVAFSLTVNVESIVPATPVTSLLNVGAVFEILETTAVCVPLLLFTVPLSYNVTETVRAKPESVVENCNPSTSCSINALVAFALNPTSIMPFNA